MGTPMSRTRYRVLALAVALAFITYLDRVCISVCAPSIMRDLSLSKMEMSYVFSAFTAAYALFEIPTGWWADRVGTRRVLTRIVTWWSCFTALTAAAWSFPSLLALRALFGAGEAGAWPNVARTFARWFPSRERGTAQGIFFMGAHLGGGVTPLIVSAILAHSHWRVVFPLFATFGFVWAAVWYRWFRDEPAEHPSVNAAERQWIESQRVEGSAHGHGSIAAALAHPSVLLLCAMYFTQTYGFNFYVTWLPTYLEKEKHLGGMMLGLFAGMPLLLSVLADLFGGLLTDRMVQRFGLRAGRCWVGGGSLALAGLFLFAGIATGRPLMAAVLIAMASAASNFLLGASWGACVDLAGSRAGTVSAAMNTAGQIGGVLSPIVFTSLSESRGSSSALALMAALYLMGAVCWIFIRPERPLGELT